MKVIWVRDELGTLYGKGANGELKDLKPFGGVFGFEIGGEGGVNRHNTLPGCRVRSGILQRDCNEIRVGNAIAYLF